MSAAASAVQAAVTVARPGWRPAGRHAVAPCGFLRLSLLRRAGVMHRRRRVIARRGAVIVRAGRCGGDGALVVGGAAAGGVVVVRRGGRGVEVGHGLEDGARLGDTGREREGRRRGRGLVLLVVVLDVLEDVAGVGVGALVEVARRPTRTAPRSGPLCHQTRSARHVRLCRERSRAAVHRNIWHRLHRMACCRTGRLLPTLRGLQVRSGDGAVTEFL
jgi:hypothetical protein